MFHNVVRVIKLKLLLHNDKITSSYDKLWAIFGPIVPIVPIVTLSDVMN